MHATIRAMLNAAVDDGLIIANPADKLGRSLQLVAKTKVRQEQIKAMDRAQRHRFLATAHTIEPWYAPMWEVQVLSGLRPGETYALQEADLDLDTATARITRTLADDGQSVDTPKGNRGRDIDLSTRAVHVLRAQTTQRKAEKLRRCFFARVVKAHLRPLAAREPPGRPRRAGHPGYSPGLVTNL